MNYLEGIAQCLLSQIRLYGSASEFRRTDEDRMTRFARKRLGPAGSLLTLAPAAGVPIALPADLPFLHTLSGWPADAPPAGWAHEAGGLSLHQVLGAQLSFWHLQAQRSGSCADRLARGVGWILEQRGYFAALEYLVDAIASGLISHSPTGIEIFHRLLSSRRNVADDSGIAAAFGEGRLSWLSGLRGAGSDWPVQPRAARPDLSDDLDWLQAQVERRIASCRDARNADEWLTGYAELCLVCRILSRAFERLGLDDDLAYGSFVARIEEIQADGGSMLMVPGLGSWTTGQDRLQLGWSMATAIAVMAEFHEADWLDHALEERVVVPDRLLDLYRRHPRDLADFLPAEWLLPSPAIRAALADVLLDEPFYPAMPVGDPEALPALEIVREEIEREGHSLPDDQSEFIHALMRAALAGEKALPANPGETDKICEVEVPREKAATLAALLGRPEHELTDWIDDIYGSICMRRTPQRLDALLTEGDGPPNGSLRSFIQLHPNCADGYAERAIELDIAGSTPEAWEMISTAIAIDPSEATFWQSASVILRRLGEESQAAVALTLSRLLEGEALRAS